MKGLGFFNGGMKAGASQPHKHMQAMPIQKDFGIFKLIKDGNLLVKSSLEVDPNVASLFTISVFEFPHLLLKFTEQFSNSLSYLTLDDEEAIGNSLRNIYTSSLKELNLFSDSEKIMNDYSLLLTEEWMFIVPRISHEVRLKNGVLNLNSACYTLSILIKTEELKEEIKSMNALDVLKRLSIK